MKQKIGIYPGTFDPVTKGHVDIIKRAGRVVDHLVIAVADNPQKKPLFTAAQRVEMIKKDIVDLKTACSVDVQSFDNLLIEKARAVNASVIIRGLRAVSDFEFEFQMAGMNAHMAPDIEAVYLMASDKYQLISSHFVKEIAKLGGDVHHFVSDQVWQKLKQKNGTL